MKILDIFPTKILGKILNNLSERELNSYKDFIVNNCSINEESKTGLKHTQNQQILNLPIFDNLKNNILKYSKAYLDNLELVYEDLQFACSWGNIVYQNGYSEIHHHNNSYLSGVFYFDYSSPISFFNKNNHQGFKLASKNNNNESFTIDPKPNLLLIFPSTLNHCILPSSSDVRISIAFNIIPKGKFGFPTAGLNL